MNTTQQTVLVTGGGSGIGFALAEKFHKAGNRVILTGRTESTLREAAGVLAGVETCMADVANADDRSRLAAQFPETTILINNAGVRYDASFAASTQKDLEHELAVNLVGPILLAQAFLPHLMQKPEAAIVNVSSGAALAPREDAAMYAASKAAMHSFTKSMRWQLESSGVRVFEVLPPLVESAMTASRGPQKGMITPEQLAEEFWENFKADRYEMAIGKVKILRLLLRLSPRLTDRIMRKGPDAR